MRRIFFSVLIMKSVLFMQLASIKEASRNFGGFFPVVKEDCRPETRKELVIPSSVLVRGF